MRPFWLFILNLNFWTLEISGQPLTMFPELKGDVFCFINNDAALAQSEAITGGFFFQRLFMVEGINNLTAAAVIPARPGGFGIAVNRIGSIEYNETGFNLSYGRKLLTTIDIGAHIEFRSISIKGYGRHSAAGYGISFKIFPVDKLSSSFLVSKSTSLYNYNFRLNYDVSSSLLLEALIEKQETHPPSIKTAIFYQPVKQIRVSISVVSAIEVVSMGIAWINNNFKVEVFSNYHRTLGYSPAMSFQVKGKDKK